MALLKKGIISLLWMKAVTHYSEWGSSRELTYFSLTAMAMLEVCLIAWDISGICSTVPPYQVVSFSMVSVTHNQLQFRNIK